MKIHRKLDLRDLQQIACSQNEVSPSDLSRFWFNSIRQFDSVPVNRARLNAPKILIIGDKEALNFEALIHFSSQYPGALEVRGIITPGSDVEEAIQFYFDSISSHAVYKDFNRASFAGRSLKYDHIKMPYVASQLGDSLYRQEWMQNLSQTVEGLNPDIIFLSNFKLTLSANFVEKFAGKIVNVHPSVLPLLKGFRSEKEVVNSLRLPEASGYTFHLVSKELDGGAVFFQQRVAVPAYDAALENTFGVKEYHARREEQHRLDIIRAQARWTARILGVICARWQDNLDGTKIVEDEDAFNIEGRPGFSETEPYRASLHLDYAHFLNDTANNISFERWYEEHRIPYRRILFNTGTDFKMLETILHSEYEVAPSLAPALALYKFKIPGSNPEAAMKAARIADAIRAADKSMYHKFRFRYDHSEQCATVLIFGSNDDAVTSVLNTHSVTDYSKEDLRTRVTAKRRTPA